jgi:hypothetical protein
MASAASIRAARAELMASILALQRVCVSLANAERALRYAAQNGPVTHDDGVPPALLHLSSSDSDDERSPLVVSGEFNARGAPGRDGARSGVVTLT